MKAAADIHMFSPSEPQNLTLSLGHTPEASIVGLVAVSRHLALILGGVSYIAYIYIYIYVCKMFVCICVCVCACIYIYTPAFTHECRAAQI